MEKYTILKSLSEAIEEKHGVEKKIDFLVEERIVQFKQEVIIIILIKQNYKLKYEVEASKIENALLKQNNENINIEIEALKVKVDKYKEKLKSSNNHNENSLNQQDLEKEKEKEILIEKVNYMYFFKILFYC